MNQVPNRIPTSVHPVAAPATEANRSLANLSAGNGSGGEGMSGGRPFQDAVDSAGSARAALVAAAQLSAPGRTSEPAPQLINVLHKPLSTETLDVRPVDISPVSILAEETHVEAEMSDEAGDEPASEQAVMSLPLQVVQAGAPPDSGAMAFVQPGRGLLSANEPDAEITTGRPAGAMPQAVAGERPVSADDSGRDDAAKVVVAAQQRRPMSGEQPAAAIPMNTVARPVENGDIRKIRTGARAGPIFVQAQALGGQQPMSRAELADAEIAGPALQPSGDGDMARPAGSPKIAVTILQVETHMQAPGQQPGRIADGDAGMTRAASAASTSAASTGTQAHELASGTEPVRVMKLHLEPGSLGSLTVRIVRQADTFQITIQPQHAHTASLLRSDAAALNTVLQSAAPLPESFNVQVLDPQPGTQAGSGATSDGSRAGASAGQDQQPSQTSARTDERPDDSRARRGEHDEQAGNDRGRGRGELYL